MKFFVKLPSFIIIACIFLVAIYFGFSNLFLKVTIIAISFLLIALYILYIVRSIIKKDNKKQIFESRKANKIISTIFFIDWCLLYVFLILVWTRPKNNCKLGSEFNRICLLRGHLGASDYYSGFKQKNVKKELKLINDNIEGKTFTLEYKLSYNITSLTKDVFFEKELTYKTKINGPEYELICNLTKITLDGKNIEIHEDDNIYRSNNLKEKSKVEVYAQYEVKYNEVDGYKAFEVLHNYGNTKYIGLDGHIMYNQTALASKSLVTTPNTPKSYYIADYDNYMRRMMPLNICMMVFFIIPIVKIPVYITSKEKKEEDI